MKVKSGQKENPTPPLIFAGDCVLSSYFNQDFVDDSLGDLIGDANISVINFEAPIRTGEPSPKWGPVLSQPLDSPKRVKMSGFDLVTLANNHIMDYGEDGLSKTCNAFSRIDLDAIGAGESNKQAKSPITYTIGGAEVSIINLAAKEFGMSTSKSAGVAWIREPGIETHISEVAQEVDSLIVVVHGGIEYLSLPSWKWQQTLHAIVGAGADAVIGHHPHVAQPWEIVNGTPIFYSLGNFAFRQENRPSTFWSYIVGLDLDDGDVSGAKVYLIETDEGEVQLMKERERRDYWDYLQQVCNAIQNSASNRGYWQSIAVKKFEDEYTGRLSDYGSGHLSTILSNPIIEGDRLTRGVYKPNEVRLEQQLRMLNLVSNECHRDIIETALSVKTEAVVDHRTESIQQEVTELQDWLSEQPTRSRWDRIRRYIMIAAKRLSPE